MSEIDAMIVQYCREACAAANAVMEATELSSRFQVDSMFAQVEHAQHDGDMTKYLSKHIPEAHPRRKDVWKAIQDAWRLDGWFNIFKDSASGLNGDALSGELRSWPVQVLGTVWFEARIQARSEAEALHKARLDLDPKAQWWQSDACGWEPVEGTYELADEEVEALEDEDEDEDEQHQQDQCPQYVQGRAQLCPYCDCCERCCKCPEVSEDEGEDE